MFFLAGSAGCDALFVPDAARRADAYRVLKLVLATATSATVASAALLKLHQAGLL